MPAAVAWSLAVLLAGPAVAQEARTPREMVFKVNASPIPGVPLPPEGLLEEELTRLKTARAATETKDALAKLDADTSMSKPEKAEIRRKIAGLKVAVFTSPRPMDQVVAFYEKTVPRAEFVFGLRDLASDLQEGIRSGVIKAAPERLTGDGRALEALARYCLRNPVRLLDFVARLVAHVPDPRRHLVHGYGAYSNVVRGKLKGRSQAQQREPLVPGPGEDAPPPRDPASPALAALRRGWAQLIRRVYEIDPLVCLR